MRPARTGNAAYKETIRETENPRSIERRVFLQVTRDLEAIEENGQLTPDAQEALEKNQKLWGSLMFDCMEPENPLPDSLKAGIISLAIFVDKQTGEIFAGRQKISSLITINRNMIRGLAGQTPASAASGG
ncbi:flagellar biosynthesis regulator FlaF [Hyphococcus sp.]|jgi:flagellar protein FlaF|uniref:flagellar biosynthesis regulator FlaF n=1 Tax=Hyphococcus sp. TaxID=2038636 RepID=UPI003D0E11CF